MNKAVHGFCPSIFGMDLPKVEHLAEEMPCVACHAMCGHPISNKSAQFRQLIIYHFLPFLHLDQILGGLFMFPESLSGRPFMKVHSLLPAGPLGHTIPLTGLEISIHIVAQREKILKRPGRFPIGQGEKDLCI